MSLIKANAVQVGQSPTATQNFTLAVPSSPDGTIKLARGNAGATTQDVMNVSNAGVVSFPQGLGNISNSTAIATGSTTARSLANRFADVVNVKDFGAVGDGVADDTAAIQAAVNAIQNTPEFFNYGGCVVLPSGKYKISDSIIINKNISIIGDGVEIIGNIFSSSKKCAFYIGSPSYIGTNNGWYKVFIEGILFNVIGHESCIFIQGIRTIKINKCVFYGGSIASVLTEECWAASSIQNCQFWNGAAKAILLRDYSNGFLISNNRIGNYNTINEVAVFVRNSSGVWIQNNDFEYNYAQITFYPTFANGCNNAHIENNWVEGSTGHSVRIDNELQSLKGVTIRGNSFYGTPDGGVYLGIFGGVGEINGAIIDGNTFNTPSQLYRNSILTRYINISSKNNFPDSSNIKCPAFRVIKSGTQAILSNTWTKITWGIENYDRGSFFSGNLWNPSTSQNSLVNLQASISFSSGIVAGDYLAIAIYKNGSLLKQSAISAQSATSGTISVFTSDIASTSDIYEAYAFASNGGTISDSASSTWFEGMILDF